VSRGRARYVIVRHGESEANVQHVFAGQSDSPLTATGRRQAEAVAAALGREPIERVISSDLSRARDTAAAIARRHNLRVETTDALREWDVGELVGLDRERTSSRYGDVARFFLPGSRVPGGESLEEVIARVTGFVEGLTPESIGKTVCLVAHGMTNRIIVAHYLRTLPRVAQGNSANTNVTIIETDGRHHEVVKLFDDAHVPAAVEQPEG
jgi:broad specificity phosphatase PhoE